jgi:hypothetical protein
VCLGGCLPKECDETKSTRDPLKPKTAKQVKILEVARSHVELLRNARRGGDTTFVSIDLEVNELNHTGVLEVGLSSFSYTTDTVEPIRTATHFIASDLEHVVNSKYVLDNRYGFIHGESIRVPTAELWFTVQEAIGAATKLTSHIVFVGHIIASDIRWMSRAGMILERAGTSVYDIGKVEQFLTDNHEVDGLAKSASRRAVAPCGFKGYITGDGTMEAITRWLQSKSVHRTKALRHYPGQQSRG